MNPTRADAAGAREGQTFAGESTLARWASFVKLPHTVFALPFALVGVTLATRVAPVTWAQVAWVVLAFTAARWVAMAVNRIVDREYDARNPRTAMREIPRGAIGVGAAWATVAVAAACFVWAASRLNPLCLALSPVALGWVCFYSFTKRFTRYAHPSVVFSRRRKTPLKFPWNGGGGFSRLPIEIGYFTGAVTSGLPIVIVVPVKVHAKYLGSWWRIRVRSVRRNLRISWMASLASLLEQIVSLVANT